jgi:hypothetical protein
MVQTIISIQSPPHLLLNHIFVYHCRSQIYELITDRRGSDALATRHPLSAKVDNKHRRQVAAAQSVQFACRLMVRAFVFCFDAF